MELTNDISYDKNLIQNDSFKIKYSGKLYNENSDEVFIVYGFDKDWKNTKEQKMEKKSDGFYAKINLEEFELFNFCFKNSQNIWDNNNGSDYHLNIEPKPCSKESSIQSLDALLDSILNEIKLSNQIQPSKPDSNVAKYLEDLFDEMFESNTSFQSCDSTESTLDLEDFFANDFIIENSTTDSDEFSSIESYNNSINNQDTIQLNVAEINNELDKLSSQSLSLEKVSSKKKSIFEFENLSPWYVLFKRIRLAFYKLFYVLPSFLFEEDDN